MSSAAAMRERAERSSAVVGVVLGVVATAIALAGCATDLGPCDGDEAAQARGWFALQESCSGTTCHASALVGPRRNAAPSGLDWDDPVRVRDHAEDIWSAIESGDMPPDSWVDAVPDATLEVDEREAVRQLLACGTRVTVAP